MYSHVSPVTSNVGSKPVHSVWSLPLDVGRVTGVPPSGAGTPCAWSVPVQHDGWDSAGGRLRGLRGPVAGLRDAGQARVPQRTPQPTPRECFLTPLTGPVENGGAAPPCGQSVPCCLQAAQWGASATPPGGTGPSALLVLTLVLPRMCRVHREPPSGPGLLRFSPVSGCGSLSSSSSHPHFCYGPGVQSDTELPPRGLHSPGRERRQLFSAALSHTERPPHFQHRRPGPRAAVTHLHA